MKVAVISDIHGNHYALERVLEDAARKGIEKLLVLGDIVGYYYHPETVLGMLEKWDSEIIKGNHEVLLKDLMMNKIGMEGVKKKYGSGHQAALDNLSVHQINQLINAPEKQQVIINGVRILMCHGANFDTNYYLYPDTNVEVLDRCNEPGVDFVVVGHSHYSFVYRNVDSTLINVGSVGQSRSAGGIANWAIINTSNKSFELVSTPYDVSELLEEVNKVDAGLLYLANVLKRNNS